MSQFYQYAFPVANVAGVALAQTPVDGGNLVLNGAYSNSVTGRVNLGFSSVLSTTSAGADLNGVTFNVTGSQNGVAVNDSIKGANGATVNGAQYFDTITDISVNGVIPNGATVSIGTSGTAGFFPLILVNTEKRVSNLGLALQFTGTAGATCIIYQSLSNSINSGQTYPQLITSNIMMLVSEVANGVVTIPAIQQMFSVCKNILVKVTNNQNALLKMQFLQL